jgi:hypothetical protein
MLSGLRRLKSCLHAITTVLLISTVAFLHAAIGVMHAVIFYSNKYRAYAHNCVRQRTVMTRTQVDTKWCFVPGGFCEIPA